MDQKEYIGIKRVGDQSYQNTSIYRALEAIATKNWVSEGERKCAVHCSGCCSI